MLALYEYVRHSTIIIETPKKNELIYYVQHNFFKAFDIL